MTSARRWPCRPAGPPRSARYVRLRANSWPMPAQKNGVGRHDGCDLREQPATERRSQFGEPAELAVVETQALPGKPGPEQSILFAQERDHIGLLTIKPTAQAAFSNWNRSTRAVYATAVDPPVRHYAHDGISFNSPVWSILHRSLRLPPRSSCPSRRFRQPCSHASSGRHGECCIECLHAHTPAGVPSSRDERAAVFLDRRNLRYHSVRRIAGKSALSQRRNHASNAELEACDTRLACRPG
jgi:hypothetical protein